MTQSAQPLDKLAAAAARARAWLDEAAYPLWLGAGQDPHGLFYEQLDFAGRPDLMTPRRVRVQARQLHVLARAAAGGHPADAAIERGLAAFETQCWGTGGKPGWIHVLTPDGAPLDTQRDTYDQAFALFALATLHGAGHSDALRLAEATLAFLDECLADPAGGYRESLPAALPRRANPHMHLLEAMLAWFEATGQARFLERANDLAGLFARQFFDAGTDTLGEYFEEDWRPAGPPRGHSVEPGHHFEWVWLLVRLAELGGDDHRPAAQRLYRFGLAHGLDADGFAVDEVDKTGALRRGTRRAWPQTELIKARLAMGDADGAAADLHRFLDGYLGTKVQGLWIDQFAAGGQALAEVVPASTLYHIVVAFDEAARVAG